MPRNTILQYNPQLKERARVLRNNPTLTEKILWNKIRKKQLGYEFHRQIPIDQFIVDFYCHERMLAIEVDGASHNSDDAKAKDLDRQIRLEKLGISFLRFRDEDVLNNLESVIQAIWSWVNEDKRK